MSKQTPPATTLSAVGPCPTVIQIVGRPGTRSLTSTIAPLDRPLTQEGVQNKKFETTVVNEPSLFKPLKVYCSFHTLS